MITFWECLLRAGLISSSNLRPKGLSTRSHLWGLFLKGFRLVLVTPLSGFFLGSSNVDFMESLSQLALEIRDGISPSNPWEDISNFLISQSISLIWSMKFSILLIGSKDSAGSLGIFSPKYF